MTNANAVIDAVSKEVVFDNVEPLAYAIGGAVVYYLIAPHIAPLLAKVPFFNQIPVEFIQYIEPRLDFLKPDASWKNRFETVKQKYIQLVEKK
jgi:hypothetical protein